MALLSETLRQDLAQRFADLDQTVTIALFTRATSSGGLDFEACPYCAEAVQLAQELAAVSPRISTEIHDLAQPTPGDGVGSDVTRVPAWRLLGPNHQDFGIRFFGIPSGYEFSTLVADLIQLAKGAPDLHPATLAELNGLDRDIAIQVFVTPTCPYCPQAVYLAHQMAMASPRVTADAFEATEFPELVQRYHVRGVPRTVVNETFAVEGAVPEAQLLDLVRQARGREQPATFSR